MRKLEIMQHKQHHTQEDMPQSVKCKICIVHTKREKHITFLRGCLAARLCRMTGT